jgi:hypothetical protein
MEVSGQNITPPAIFTALKELRYPMNRRMFELQSSYERLEAKKISYP